MLHDMRDMPVEVVVIGGKQVTRVACAGNVVIHGGKTGPVQLKEALGSSINALEPSVRRLRDEEGRLVARDRSIVPILGPGERPLLTGKMVVCFM